MPACNWTDEQKHAIFASGGSVLVSAAAGSGKTAVLVERVIQKIISRENPVPADRLLVVTFTKAAAAEMKQRVAAALAGRIAEQPDNSYLLEQQLLLSKAHISTIHAFCADMLRTHFEIPGISPDFRIADDTEITLIKQRTADSVISQFYEQDDPGFLTLADFFGSRNDQLLTSQVLLVYEFIRSHPFPLKWLDKQQARYRSALDHGVFPWEELVFEYVCDACDYAVSLSKMAEHMMDGDAEMTQSYLETFLSDREYFQSLSDLAQNKDWDVLVSKAVGHKFQNLKPLRAYNDPEKKEIVSSMRGELKSVAAKCGDVLGKCGKREDVFKDIELLYPVISTLFDVVREVYAQIEQAKKEKNILDFSDLELLTLQLLLEEKDGHIAKTPLALQYQEQFDEIMVDEYQDTNEVQDAIFHALSRDETNLFMVGDVKQSIYRFRKAMPELFLKKSQTYHPFDGTTFPARIQLDANFRSRSEVTSAVNFFFGCLMSPALGEVDYGKEMLHAQADYPATKDCETRVDIIDCSDTPSEDEKRIVYEARHIAAEIRRMLAEKTMVYDHGTERPCRLNDFCILLRSVKDKASVFEEEFQKQGLPIWSDSSCGYLGSEEIAVMMNLLKVIDNPLQDIPLLSVLVSPMYGLSPDEIAEIRLVDRELPLYLALCRFGERGNTKVISFLKQIDAFRQYAAVSRLDQLIERIYDQTGFIALASASQTGEQRAANLRLLLEYATYYEQAGYRGVSGFIRYIDRALEQGSDLSGANVLNESANVVRLMTIHHSKGLEFPICFLADLSKKFNKIDLYGDVLLHPDLGIAMKVRDQQLLKRYSTLPYEALAITSEKEMLSEELRTLYVAMTRAKERLILVASCPNPEKMIAGLRWKLGSMKIPSAFFLQNQNSYAEWIFSALLYHPSFYQERTGLSKADYPVSNLQPPEINIRVCDPLSEQEVELPVSGKEEDILPNQELLSEFERNFSYRYPYQAAVALPSKLAVTQLAKMSEESSVILARPAFLTGRKFTAAERGTILHRFMQHIDLCAADAAEEIKRQLNNGFLNEEQASTIVTDQVNAFLNSALAERMRAAGVKLYREFKFMYDVDANELFGLRDAQGERILLQGVADAVLIEDDGLIIIDYKTDHVLEEDELKNRYRNQLSIYAKALAQSFGLPVKQCLLYSLQLMKEIEL